MAPNAASSAVTTGGTFSIGSEGVLTPNVRRARYPEISRRADGGKPRHVPTIEGTRQAQAKKKGGQSALPSKVRGRSLVAPPGARHSPDLPVVTRNDHAASRPRP